MKNFFWSFRGYDIIFQVIDEVVKIAFLPILPRLFHKPLAEQGFGHGFEGFVLAVQQVDFVVKAAQDGGDGFLFIK